MIPGHAARAGHRNRVGPILAATLATLLQSALPPHAVAADTAITAAVPALTAPKASAHRLIDVTRAGDAMLAVGQQGVILRSDDGRTWQQVASPVSTMLTRVIFTDAQHGWVLGYEDTLLHSDDGGRSWTLRHRDREGRALYDLVFLDSQRGLAVGAYGTVLTTADGGHSWQQDSTVLGELGMHLNVLLQMDDGSLFVAGERGLMARSTDAGTHWQILDFPYAGTLFGARLYGDAGGVLVHGMRGRVYLAADLAQARVMDASAWDPYARESLEDDDAIAARGWQRIDTPVEESLFGSLALPDGRLLLLGVNGTVLALGGSPGTGPGLPLQLLRTPATETLSRAALFDSRVIAVGRRGVLPLLDLATP